MFLPFVPPPKRKRPLHPFGCVPSHSKKPIWNNKFPVLSLFRAYRVWLNFQERSLLSIQTDQYYRQYLSFYRRYTYIYRSSERCLRTTLWYERRSYGAGNLENISSTNFRHSWNMLKLIIIVISRIADTYANSYFYGYN